MKILFLVLSFLLSFLSWSQVKIELSVVDDSTHEPLPYATVRFTNKNEGFYCDKQGMLKFSAALGDTVVITYTGYIQETVKKFSGNLLTVKLKRKNYLLPEFTVKTFHENGRRKEIGYHKKSKSVFMGSQMMLEFAVKLELPDDTTLYKILEIIVPLQRKKDINRLRIHLYGVNELGLPGDELLKSDILLSDENNEEMKKNGRFDVSKQSIIVSSKNIFVGVEWISEVEVSTALMGPSVKFTDAFKGAYTYVRMPVFFGGEWRLNSYLSPYAKQGYSENLAAGLRIQAVK
jgi:hypothetical protein